MVHPGEEEQPPAPGSNSKSSAVATATAPAKPAPAKASLPRAQGYAHLFKFVLIGDSGCGKSALLARFTQDQFSEERIYTIGVDFAVKEVGLPNGDQVKLQIWDTAGQERFRTITNSYYRGAHAILIVYEVNDEESFNSVERWVNEAQRFCTENTLCYIIGNKSDLQTAKYFGKDKVQEMLRENGIALMEGAKVEDGVSRVFETSAKTGEGVSEVFSAITDDLVSQRLNERNPLRGGKGRKKGHDTIHLADSVAKPKGGCCR